MPPRWITAATLPLLPIILAQGLYARLTIPHLPIASPPTQGRTHGRGSPLHLTLMGESTVAGVGAATHVEGLAGETAVALAQRLKRPVCWHAIGENGYTAASVRAHLLPRLSAATDVVLIALGANDTLRLHSTRRWQEDLTALAAAISAKVGTVPIFLAAVPPLGSFPALPQPLRWFCGVRAARLDGAAAALAVHHPQLHYIPHLPIPMEPHYFAADGFHPSAAGYSVWGRHVASRLAQSLEGAYAN